MALHLVVARCGPSASLLGDIEHLSEAEQAALLDASASEVSCALAQLLPTGRVAIGRREGTRCVWWVGAEFPTDPPHALWSEPGLFTAEGEATIPTIEPAALLPALAAVEGIQRAAKVVAGAVRLLRASDAPIGIVASAPPDALEALALTIAAALGGAVSVAVNHPEPDPTRYRLAVGPTVYDGYELIDASEPPDEDDDLVAWFVRDRLRSDPASVFVPGGVTESHVRAALQSGGLPLSSSLEGRSHAVTARIREGAELDPPLLDELLAITELTSDPRPWVALRRRPSVVRRAAAEAALSIASRLRPTEALLEALSAVYPRGAPLGPWCAALLDWVRRAAVPDPFVAALERALEEWPQSATRANRVSVWTELVHVLVEQEHYAAAQAAVTGRSAERLIREGSGDAIATLWGTLPADRRNPRRLQGMVEMLARHSGGDRSAGKLYLHSQDNAAEVDVLIRSWLRNRGPEALDRGDGLLKALARTEHLPVWLEWALQLFSPEGVVPLLPRLASGPEDPLWLVAEEALGRTTPPGLRFANLAALSEGLVALEPLARARVSDALEVVTFPDASVADVARQLIDVPMGAAMWPWLAVVASSPGQFNDKAIDGTVVDLCAAPPNTDPERRACVRAAELLGLASEWDALDHARWLVRIALAPDGDQTGFRDSLVAGLVAGLVARSDGRHLAKMTRELMQLPPDHPALVGLLQTWLPQTWSDRVPADFVQAVEAGGVPEGVVPQWQALASRC